MLKRKKGLQKAGKNQPYQKRIMMIWKTTGEKSSNISWYEIGFSLVIK